MHDVLLYVLHVFAGMCIYASACMSHKDSHTKTVIHRQSYKDSHTKTHTHCVSEVVCHTSRGYSGHYKGIEEEGAIVTPPQDPAIMITMTMRTDTVSTAFHTLVLAKAQV